MNREEKGKAGGVSRFWFRHRAKMLAVGGAYDDLAYRHPVEGFWLQITRICVEAKGSNPEKIRVYVKGHGYEHWVGEEAEPSHSTLYWIEWPTYLTEGEQLVARFYGMDATNELEMLVEGWAYDPPTMLTNIDITIGGVKVV